MIHANPRLLVIDDLFGRGTSSGPNRERDDLCAHFLWKDATEDAAAAASSQRVLRPKAEVVFCRAQVPVAAGVGDRVENDLHVALQSVRAGWQDALAAGRPPWAMVLLDLCFYTGLVTAQSDGNAPGMPPGRDGDDDPGKYFGMTLLNAIHREAPELPIVMFSSKPRAKVSLEFSRGGALGFIARDDANAPELLDDAIWLHGLMPDPEGEVVGHSLPVLLALREARRAARHRGNLLIRGERGTGKEVLARYAHRVSGSSTSPRPFVAVNSAILRTEIFSAELFGIEPRTATGVDGKSGLIESATGGDLFLDEIADMPAEAQAAILRVLQDRQITRLGARASRAVDVRFISATNAELESGATALRPDLLDRLRLGGTLWLPPLHERRADIPVLAMRFIREAEAQYGGAIQRSVDGEALQALLAHDWPGNIRELRSCLFDAVSRHPDVEHLVRGHLRLGQPVSQLSRPATDLDSRGREQRPVAGLNADPCGIEEALSAMARARFSPERIASWSGRLYDIQRTSSWLGARLLLAALDATKRRTPQHPAGIIQIHPAVKLITGDRTLTASRAADVIKRLLGPIEEELEGDLREALAVATRLRPKSPRSPSPHS